MLMPKKDISGGTVHQIPMDLRHAIMADKKAHIIWQGLTPLARNEWICWTISPKQPKTRDKHINRVVSELKEGLRRPCCWLGCIHRKDKPINSSVQFILSKQNKSRNK